MSSEFSFLADYGSFFVTGAKYTLILSLLSAVFGIIIGGVLALMKISKSKIIKSIAYTTL